MFRPLYVGHLQVEIELTDQLYKMCGAFVWGLGGGVGEQDLVVSIMVIMTQGSSCLCTHTCT